MENHVVMIRLQDCSVLVQTEQQFSRLQIDQASVFYCPSLPVAPISPTLFPSVARRAWKIRLAKCYL